MRHFFMLVFWSGATLAKPWVAEHAEQPAWKKRQSEAIELANGGRAHEALEIFQEVVRMERSAENINNLGVALGQVGRYRESHEAFIRALNFNANNVGVYQTFLQIKPRLSFDLAEFLAKERKRSRDKPPARAGVAADPPAVPAAEGPSSVPQDWERGKYERLVALVRKSIAEKRVLTPDELSAITETASASASGVDGAPAPPEAAEACSEPAIVDAVPSAMAHLRNRTNGMRPWAAPTVLVIARWKEDLAWAARPELAQLPRVVYQRHDAAAELYSPNVGFEASVYLQFIVEHYWNLPEQMVFLQGDAGGHVDLGALGETLRCLRAGEVGYYSLSTHPMISRRNLARYTGAHPPARVAAFHAELPRCAKRLLALFGVPLGRFTEPIVSAYCCAVFTVSRAAVLRHPYAAWRAAYEMVGAPSDAARCVWNEPTARARAPGASAAEAYPALGLPDLNEAFLMEHLWHVIFGQPLLMPPQRADETCAVARCGKLCPDPSTPHLGLFGTPPPQAEQQQQPVRAPRGSFN